MSTTSDAATFTGPPDSVLSPRTETPAFTQSEQPVPGGTAPTSGRKVAPAKPAKAAAKRGRGRPPKAPTRRPENAAEVAQAAADAAATALERETAQAKRGRPSNADVKNAQLEEGLTNFYIGVGGMAKVAGMFMRVQRLDDVGQAMIVQAGPCARALVAAADQSQAIRDALEWLTKAGGASLVLAAHAPILLAALGMGAPQLVAADAPTANEGDLQGFDIATLLGGMMGGFGATPDAAAA